MRSTGDVVLAGLLMAAAVAATVGLLPTNSSTQLAVAVVASVLVGMVAYLGSIAALGVPVSLRPGRTAAARRPDAEPVGSSP